MLSKVFILGAMVAAAAAAPLKWRALAAADKGLYTYDHFVLEFGKERSAASEAIFNAKLAEVHAHNGKGATWTMGVNQFTDMTETEFAKYKGKVFDGTDAATGQLHFEGPALGDLPTSLDWRTKGAVTPVKNQGGCGSCWAFSSTESVESAVFMATGVLPVLAPQEFVDCIPNPNQCGGTGGCAGSTEEYGFAYAMLYGVAAESSYPYTATTGKSCLLNQGGRVPVAGVSNFVKLPANDAVALMQALNINGPVSISVDASWGGYENGVYQGCANKTTIDHAVQAVGYGTEAGVDYWLVRNSWGTTWGEEGYIKLPRSTTPTCGIDSSPGSGNGCKSGTPKEQTVCGPCGMLSDSSYPTGGYLMNQTQK